MRDRPLQDELDHDTQQGQWKPFEDSFNSIFIDNVDDLPLQTKKDGEWVDIPNTKFKVLKEG